MMSSGHPCAHTPPAATTTTMRVEDLPEACLAEVIALTSPRDASRCAAVSPAFRAAADSDDVWRRFLPPRLLPDGHLRLLQPPPASTSPVTGQDGRSKKDAYLDLCDAGALVDDDSGGGVKVWLEKATGARCYALSARRLSLPWDDGEFSWRWTKTHPLSSRFPEVAELVDCTCLDIYGTLPAAALTPATPYAAYLVYGTAAEGGHRGLSYPDQETAVAVGGRVVARHAVCLLPNEEEARKFIKVVIAAGGDEAAPSTTTMRLPKRREDGWWEMEMGRLDALGNGDGEKEEKMVASFEVMGWYPKRGLVMEAVEFRPVH